MDRQTLLDLVADGPIRMRMNNGDEYVVTDPNELMVDESLAFVMTRNDEGKLRVRLLSLVAMCSAERVDLSAS